MRLWKVTFKNNWSTVVIANNYSDAVNSALDNYSIWHSDKPVVVKVN